MVEIEDLGPLRVGGVAIEDLVPSPLQRELFASLVSAYPLAVSTDRLLEILWPGQPSKPRLVWTHVSRLRRCLADLHDLQIEAVAGGYRLAGQVQLDRERFEAIVRTERERSGSPASSRRGWERALALFRGEFLEGYDAARLSPGHRERLHELHIEAALGSARQRLDGQDLVGLLTDLDDLAIENPYSESVVELLAIALYRLGRRAECLSRIHAFRSKLAEETGLEVGPSLASVERQILVDDPALTPLHLAGADARGSRLPEWRTSLVGRSSELNGLQDTLKRARLLSLVGPGGVGKTRLGVELGRRAAGGYDGVWFCDLSSLHDLAAVPHALAEMLGVRSQPGRSTAEAIVEWLADRRALLIVDNCEHLTSAVSSLVDLVLSRCQRVTVVATSRETLGVTGEHVWMVPPLANDAERSQLFCDRAVAADSEIVFSADDLQTVRGICRRLDGLPLAIELAAPRLRFLSLQQIADRLDDRFSLLQGGLHSPGPERHQTIGAAIDWSYSLLDDQERTCFERLAVFSGEFDFDAVEAVLPGQGIAPTDAGNLFGRLVDRSLVNVRRAEGQTRYRLLETLREFAQQRLNQHDAEIWRERHAHHYFQVADRADALLVSNGWIEGAAVFERDWSNIRTALSWALENQELGLAARIVERTSWFAALKVRLEHRRWAHQVLDLAMSSAVEPSPAVAGIAAWWAMGQADASAQLELAEIGLQSASHPAHPSTNWSWHALTVYHFYAGDIGAYEEDLRSWQRASSEPRDRFHRSLMAGYRTYGGSPNQIEQGRLLASELAQQLPNPALEVWATWAAGNAARTNGNLEDAIDAYNRTLELAQAADLRIMDATAAIFVLYALADQGGQLRPMLQLRCFDVLDHHRITVEHGLAAFARHLLTQGHAEHAAVIAGYLRTMAMIGPLLEFVEEIDHAESVNWQQEGATLDRGQAIAYAKAILEALPTDS